MIKFEANGLKSQLDHFCKQSEEFIALNREDFLSFSLKDNAAQQSIDSFHNFFKIDLEEPFLPYEPKDMTPLIKQLYEKVTEKKEIKKSLHKFMSNRNTPAKPIVEQ